MKKIGIFHSITNESEIQKNFLFFDELQTSYSFLNNLTSIVEKYPNTQNGKFDKSAFMKKIEKLERMEIISVKEDIENRILPEIGSFDSSHYKSDYKLSIKNTREELALQDYFKHLREINEKYHVEIHGRFNILNLLGARIKPINNDSFSNVIFERGGVLEFMNSMGNSYSRSASVLLNSYFNDVSYFPIIGNTKNYFSEVKPELELKKSNIYKLVIEKFPVPQNTKWEKVIEFKKDKDSLFKLLELRKWISNISRTDKSLSEVNDELEYMIIQYENALKLHKIKYATSGLEAIIIPTVEVIEKIVKFQFSKAAKLLFGIGNKRIEMLEAERKIEGREVAYLSRLNKKMKN